MADPRHGPSFGFLFVCLTVGTKFSPCPDDGRTVVVRDYLQPVTRAPTTAAGSQDWPILPYFSGETWGG